MDKKQFKIFLVDDDTKHLVMLKNHLEKKSDYDLKVNIFSSGENCLDKMHEDPDVIVLDYYLDGIKADAANGLEILKKIKEMNSDAYVIMMSGQDNLKVAVDTINYGAYDYIIKGESAYIRAQMIIDHIIGNINMQKFFNDQKRKETMLFVIIVVLFLALLMMALFSRGFI